MFVHEYFLLFVWHNQYLWSLSLCPSLYLSLSLSVSLSHDNRFIITFSTPGTSAQLRNVSLLLVILCVHVCNIHKLKMVMVVLLIWPPKVSQTYDKEPWWFREILFFRMCSPVEYIDQSLYTNPKKTKIFWLKYFASNSKMCKGEKGFGLEIDMYGVKLFCVKSNMFCWQKEVMGTIKCVMCVNQYLVLLVLKETSSESSQVCVIQYFVLQVLNKKVLGTIECVLFNILCC